MKKYFIYALSGAIALTSMHAFTACSSSDDTLAEQPKVEDNPTYDPVTKSVTTKFVLNVSSAATTRQSSAIVHAGCHAHWFGNW